MTPTFYRTIWLPANTCCWPLFEKLPSVSVDSPTPKGTLKQPNDAPLNPGNK
jgi:hypothetical protein